MERISWYLKRLSVMGPGELCHRVGEQWRLRRLSRGQLSNGNALLPTPGDWREFEFCTSDESKLPELPWNLDNLLAAHPRVFDGEWPALGFHWTWEPDPEVWHRAPDTGRQWPGVFFGAVPYRAGNPYGDVRVVWEPARLQQMTAMALVARNGPEDQGEALARLAVAQLVSWTDGNPPFRGVHYVSAMECALRLVAVCHAFDLFRVHAAAQEGWQTVVELVASHALLIEQRLSLHSSSGNHTIAECAGLVYAGILFPELPGSDRRLRTGLDLLAHEADRQILSDGGGIERALHYHRFVMDLLGLVGRLLRHAGMTVPAGIDGALERGAAFLAAVTSRSGETFPVGDGDGGYALLRQLELFGPAPPDRDVVVTSFPETGYSTTVIDQGVELRVLFDHGPLGMAPSYGHAHADALSLVLYCDGEAALIDPGTFTYTGDPALRRYFRSTAAHNTISVDGGDQAHQETAFQWTSPPECRLIRAGISESGVVQMLGFLAVSGPPSYTHLRGVAHAPNGWIFVWDFIESAGVHSVTQHWHCGVDVRKTDTPQCLRLSLDSQDLEIVLEGAGPPPEIVRGEMDPPLGWKSPAYGVREPCSVIRRRMDVGSPTSMTTTISLPDRAPPDAVREALIAKWQEWAGDA